MSSQSSNPNPPETSCMSSSPSESSAFQLRAAHFDEAAVAALATSNPKKRAGRRIFKETRHPIFRGVRMRNNNKWVCELREPSNKKSRIWLGTYPIPEMAARAHDVAALAFKGKSACLNFADSSWRLPLPVSKEAKDIRRAAREGAELFRPREFGGVAQVEETGKSVDSGGKNNFQGNGEFMDEESVFDMPGMNIANMAEGPLLSPPRYTMDDSFWSYKEDIESDVDVSLWSYSI